ncbi:uncharacterized protein LOC110242973 [Exaiptasia diaphana]|uniref:Orn/DAP/Arg decarboxylase 2 N-terminal domain-containing protein n=1 Tax=Exaiptasia diaphana TaxID=2652724 RepID=A0A913XHZ9_EXADI|nr:uncharacterized protein LOC110242973 [Exaiptasia diaphana]KXJ11867.1 Diaminopimelate decarboxylase [Exaiptasia diaphana]
MLSSLSKVTCGLKILLRNMSGKTAKVALPVALQKGLIGSAKTLVPKHDEPHPCALFFDLDEFEANLQRAKDAFGEGFLHAMAIKANPIHEMIKICKQKGIGTECASIGEVINSLEAGIDPKNIVYDSPVKTRPELEFALKNGLHVNTDNYQELEVISEIMKDISNFQGTVGLRINPVMAAGDIKELSVSTTDSKFAVPLTESSREEVIGWFVERPWMTCVHVHIGSQSYGVAGLCQGAKSAVDLALDINKRVGRNQVDVIDIGGGMGVNRKDDSISPTFQEYADCLEKTVPQIFPSKGIFKKIITEFGQALNAKAGWIASQVEYTKKIPDSDHTIALIHVGADMCMRTCYVPHVDKYKRRVEVFDSSGIKKSGKEAPHNIAGPLCFAGDVVSRDIILPQIEKGDFVILHDCGANSVSTFSRHCSRFVPPVIGYRVKGDEVHFQTLKDAETIEQNLAFWGAKSVTKYIKCNNLSVNGF